MSENADSYNHGLNLSEEQQSLRFIIYKSKLMVKTLKLHFRERWSHMLSDQRWQKHEERPATNEWLINDSINIISLKTFDWNQFES